MSFTPEQDQDTTTDQEKLRGLLRFLAKLTLSAGSYLAKHEPEGKRAELLQGATLDARTVLWAMRDELREAIEEGHPEDCTCYENLAKSLAFEDIDPDQLKMDFVGRRLEEGIDALAAELAANPEGADALVEKFAKQMETQFGVEVDAKAVVSEAEAEAKLRESRDEDGKPKAERFREERDDEGRVFIVDSQGTIVA